MLGEGEMRVRTRAHVLVLGHGRVPGLVQDLGLGPHGTTEGVILMNLRGMEGMAEGVEVGLGLEGGEEVDVLGTVRVPGPVPHHPAEALGLRVDAHQATSVAGMEDAGRGRLRTLCVPAAHGRDLILVPVPDLHVLARGRAPCLTLLTRDTVGAGAGVVRVLDL